ncbi:MAG TPA: phage tail protein [Candidatus Dormibacteraeota bacterium]|nr:phage tail protein [Candidatus Dormibacteraeota bacterium]
MPETALSPRFTVSIDGYGSLGSWTKCDGLSVEYEVFEYQEGGRNDYVHRLPGRRKYPNVKLTRPLDRDSQTVVKWVSGMVSKVERQTAEIAVLDGNGQVVCRWNLSGVCPVKWTGPTLDAAGNQVASETLELAHNGFLDAG